MERAEGVGVQCDLSLPGSVSYAAFSCSEDCFNFGLVYGIMGLQFFGVFVYDSVFFVYDKAAAGG